jgi:hypothetical protein
MKRSIFFFSLFVFTIIFSSFSLAGCSTQGSDEKKLPMEVILDGTFSAIDDKREVLINDNEKYQSLMNEVYKNLDQMPRIPVVDFSKNSVVAVFIGPRNNGGYLAAIDSINEGSGSISVNVTETIPGKNCTVVEVATKPFSIVKIPKTDKKPVFKTKQIVKDCK